MKQIFIPNTNGKHVKDGVRGNVHDFPEGVKTNRPILENLEGITDYVAPTAVKPMRSITQRQLIDGLDLLGAAVAFEALLNTISAAERLRFYTSPLISPDYAFIVENRAMLLTQLNLTGEQFDNLFRA